MVDIKRTDRAQRTTLSEAIPLENVKTSLSKKALFNPRLHSRAAAND